MSPSTSSCTFPGPPHMYHFQGVLPGSPMSESPGVVEVKVGTRLSSHPWTHAVLNQEAEETWGHPRLMVRPSSEKKEKRGAPAPPATPPHSRWSQPGLGSKRHSHPHPLSRYPLVSNHRAGSRCSGHSLSPVSQGLPNPSPPFPPGGGKAAEKAPPVGLPLPTLFLRQPASFPAGPGPRPPRNVPKVWAAAPKGPQVMVTV